MPTFGSGVFLQCFLAVVTLSCLANVGNTWRRSMTQEYPGKEETIHAFTSDDEPARVSSKFTCLVAFLLTQSGLGRHRFRSHAMQNSKLCLRTNISMSLPKGDAELSKLLKVAPALGSALAISRGEPLEVNGEQLKNDRYDTAIVVRQVQSAMHRGQSEEDMSFEIDRFPQTVNAFREVLESDFNHIFYRVGPRPQYDFENAVGKGTQSVVYKARCTEDGREKFYAVKAIPFNPAVEEIQVRMAIKEILTMVKAKDQHMVTLHDAFFMDCWNGTAEAPVLHMVLDYGSINYDRFLLTRKGPEWDKYRYESKLYDMLQMSLAVRAMHVAGIAHKDLKPLNVMCFDRPDGSGMDLKLIDFGTADGPGVGGSFFSNDPEFGGTPEFMPPEVAENFVEYENAPNTIDGRAMDLWALGITLYYLLTGDVPFHRGNTGDPDEDIEILCKEAMQYKKDYPASAFTFDDEPMALRAKHVINGLLHPTPELRMSIDETIVEVRRLLQFGTPLGPMASPRARPDRAFR